MTSSINVSREVESMFESGRDAHHLTLFFLLFL